MNLRSLFSVFSSDLAIDLGTANTLVFARGKGIVVDEPSIVAINKTNGEIEAVGREAKEMLGRTPGNIVAIRPMKDGVIADFKVTEKMLNYFIQKAHNRKMLVHPRIVIGVPSEITQVEKRAVMDSAYRAQASEVHLVEQAMVAAIGAGLPITEPSGNMVVDIGGGTTDVAVISMSGIVYSRSVRIAGNEMDEAIMQYMKRKYNLLIGERTAEQVKIEVGSAYPLDKPMTMEIKGRNLIEGVPKTVMVDDSEIREALGECVATIINAIRVALERTPPELSADISDRGIVLTGGGAMLRNLDKRIREETGLPVSIAENPLASVVLGTGKMLSDFKLLRKFLLIDAVETFLGRYRNITTLAVAIFAQLLLLGYQIRGDRDVRLIRLWGVTAITPVARVLHSSHGFVSGLFQRYIWLYGARRDNDNLQAEVGRLKLENQSLRNSLETSDRLKILAAYQQQLPSKTLIAAVIGAGANPNSRVVFLDKGSHAGIQPGMAVITPDGIVGKIQSVFPTSALVLLVSDASSAAGVLPLEKTRVHGVMKGTGFNEARIDYIPNEEKVAVGERVYTSGEDRIYPKGLLVGAVSSVQAGRDFQNITVRPGVRLNRLEEVLVVTTGVHQGLPDTAPRPQAPQTLLPPPPPEVRHTFLDAVSPTAQAAPPMASATPATTAGPDGNAPQTDADRLKKRYRDLGAAQGHIFGEGAPGSKPPDFNLGWTPPNQQRPAEQPKRQP